ncbi:uncharacterized protein [Bemisia tabaci]
MQIVLYPTMNNDYVHATQWAFNLSAYQNMANDEVDWATLAQQWIKMKETCPQMTAAMVVPPPPPPVIGPTNSAVLNKDPNKEEGEAPMEMDNIKEDTENSIAIGGLSGDSQTWGQWSSNWNQWSWGWGQVDPKLGTISPNIDASGYGASTPAFTPAEVVATPARSYNQEYWTARNSDSYVRNKGDTWASSSRRGSRRRSRDQERKEDTEDSEPPVLDAAKRRSLPAWIREGLEKMEREKQKKIEQEQLKQECQKQALENVKQASCLEQSNDPKILMKSKFDSDSEDDGNAEADASQTYEKTPNPKFKGPSTVKYRRAFPSIDRMPLSNAKSKEQIMEETMLQVRRILTQILMEVTTYEMEKVVNQVHSLMQKKAPAPSNEKTPQSSVVTGKLGLGIYDSESDNSSGEEAVPNTKDGEESDREIKERIVRKRKDFQKVEREIEVHIEQQEEKERRALANDDSENSISESDADESVDARNISSKELKPRTRQQDTANKGQVPRSFQAPAEPPGERSKTLTENLTDETSENRVFESKSSSLERSREKTEETVRGATKDRSISQDADSSSTSSDSSYSTSTSSSSCSSRNKRSKAKLKLKAKKESKDRSRSKGSRDEGSSYSRHAKRLSSESHSSSQSKHKRSSSRESRIRASSKRSTHSSERSKKRNLDRCSRSGSWERERHKSRSHSRNRCGKSRSPRAHRSSYRSHSHRSTHSKSSRSPSSKYSQLNEGKTRHEKWRRRYSDSSPEYHCGKKKHRRR